MKYVQEYSKDVENASTIEDLINITRDLADGKVQYAFPYQLKTFIIEYAKIVLSYIVPPVADAKSS